jgi:PAS domain-containing protein
MDGDLEQYSDHSRDELRRATEQLVAGLQRYSEVLSGMHGGTAELAELLGQNSTIEGLVLAWNKAAFDHTGTTPVVLDDADDIDFDEDEDEDQVAAGEVLSIVTRIDLTLDDPEALITAGRAAYRRLWPDETDEDVSVAVDDPAQALYAVTHEAGEAWLDVPGTGVVRAVRAYVVPDDSGDVTGDDPDDAELLQDLAVPPGTIVYREYWS